MPPVRVRFAPSPTGELHVGNARTAIFNWLYARRQGGSFVLRIEDTDLERSSAESERSILEDLDWLGLNCDEGPVTGGPYAPYKQSQRKAVYQEYADRLLREGKAYPCFCTEEELEEKKKLFIKKGAQPRYDGRCRDLSEEERRRLTAEGRRPATRFKIEQKELSFDDLVRGNVTFNCELIGDFIILRSDGMAAYNFSAAVDDALMRIDHVFRGEDHLSNTPRQILVLRALGFDLPRYAHLSIIVDQDRTKLKKREKSSSLRHFREEGFLADAVVNYLALLGWSPEDGGEFMTREELTGKFSPERCSKSSAMYDIAKLRWLNAQHLRRLGPGRLLELSLPFVEAAGFRAGDYGREWLTSVLTCIRDNVETLAEIKTYLPIFLTPVPPIEEASAPETRSETGLRVVEAFRRELERVPAISEQTFSEIVKSVKSQLRVSGKALFMPIRVALTGCAHGPELAKIFSLLPKETLLGRLDKVLRP
ncbi:MAG: glutamate--tRNA ligase [Nitrospinae bacterium]|nr:glutamate--tRNA ligase [Nitrospinota bacterium]